VPLTAAAPSKQGFTYKATKSVRFKPKWKNQRYQIHVIMKQAKKSEKLKWKNWTTSIDRINGQTQMIKQERRSSKIRNPKNGWHTKKNLKNRSRIR